MDLKINYILLSVPSPHLHHISDRTKIFFAGFLEWAERIVSHEVVIPALLSELTSHFRRPLKNG